MKIRSGNMHFFIYPRIDPTSYSIGELLGTCVSLKGFTLVCLGLQCLDQLVVLLYPVTPAACTSSRHLRIELIASQPKELLSLFCTRSSTPRGLLAT
jgi:hypothetical protein